MAECCACHATRQLEEALPYRPGVLRCRDARLCWERFLLRPARQKRARRG